MPWHKKPKKDVVACDKLRGVGKQTLWLVDVRMGKPRWSHVQRTYGKYIAIV